MIDLKHIDAKVEQVLETQSVGWAQRVMQSRSGLFIIAMISFVESALPIPILTDPFIAAGILLNRKRTISIIILATLASVLGGLFAFASAAFFFDLIVSYMTADMVAQFNDIIENNDGNTLVLTIVGSVTPIPYTIVAWAVAVIKGNLLVFLVASIFGRGFRYAIVGYCTYKFGPAALTYARKYLAVTSLTILVLAIAYIWYKM
tara:strand:- start:4521 stop:5132 length:612 start_codon:yes stop_codon:yes gene_type:complete